MNTFIDLNIADYNFTNLYGFKIYNNVLIHTIML